MTERVGRNTQFEQINQGKTEAGNLRRDAIGVKKNLNSPCGRGDCLHPYQRLGCGRPQPQPR